LEEAAGDPHLGPLALLLRLMVVEHPNATQYTLQAALAVLKTNPECERAHEARCEVGGVANLHAATVEAPREFARALPALLRAMPALPEKVGARLDAGLADTGLADALTEAAAGDRREPSWAALGLLVRETQFLHDARRLLFMRDSWSVPTEEAAAEALKRVPADHPYRPFIASFALSPRSPEYARALRSIAPRLPEPTIYPLIVKLVQLDPNQPVVDRALAHCDLIARDLTQAVHLVAGPSKPKYARPLLKLCPHAPSAQAALVRFDWPAAAGQAAEWEADGHPAVLRALGERHAGQNRLADAERCLRKASDLSPDRPTYRLLAQVYRGRGDLERWKATLEGFLTQEDAGLDHAQVRVELARYHMARGEWDRATPYAEAAAETYAEWALRCASECAEGAGDLAKSEQWITRAAERYPGSAVEWFYWCSRTGRGDIAAARRAAAAYARGLGERPNRGDIFGVAVFHLANGDPAAALELMDRPSSRGALIFSLYVAALADAGGKADLRDERLKPDAARPDAVGRYATLLRKVTEGGAEPTVKELDAAVAALPESQRQAMLYPVGVMLYTHGRQKEGLAYLERLATAPGNESVYRTVAVAALRERGAEPGKYPAAKP
jgi:tetratricopeptide (TPR) repeat protein